MLRDLEVAAVGGGEQRSTSRERDNAIGLKGGSHEPRQKMDKQKS